MILTPVLGRPLEDVVPWHALDAGNVHWSPLKTERRFQSAIAGCDSMQACMGISSLTTISSRQTGCGMLASVWHIRATTVICMLVSTVLGRK